MFKTILGPAGFNKPLPQKLFSFEVCTERRDEWTKLCQRVAWELIQIGFRYELSALDRQLVPNDEHRRDKIVADVFPPAHGIQLKDFPSWSRGLGAHSSELRAPYLDAFRRLLLRWPDVPSHFEHISFVTLTSPDEYTSLEVQLLVFYCQMFFDVSGRPPTILYEIPV